MRWLRGCLLLSIALPAMISFADSPTPPASKPSLFIVHCVDSHNHPVPGADVYLVIAHINKESVLPATGQTFGPIVSDAAGVAQFQANPQIAETDGMLHITSFARIVGKSVGIAAQTVRKDSPIKKTIQLRQTITLSDVAQLHGRIAVPRDFKANSGRVHVTELTSGEFPDITTIGQNDVENALLDTIYKPTIAPDGTFTIADLPVDSEEYHLQAEGPGLADDYMPIHDLPQDQTLVFTMQPEGIIRGRVLLPDSQPAANILVKISSHSYTTGVYKSAITDARGQYAFDKLPQDSYTIQLVATNNFALPPKTIPVDAGQTVQLDLPLATGAIISGKVTGSDGEPVAQAIVALLESAQGGQNLGGGTTDANGEYHFRATPGKYGIYVGGTADYLVTGRDPIRTVVVPATATAVRGPSWVLPRLPKSSGKASMATVQGRVVDDHGKPVAHLFVGDVVADSPEQGEYTNFIRAGRTDADGRFQLSILAGHGHLIHPSGEECDQPAAKEFKPAPGSTRTLPDFVVHAKPVLATVTAIVTDPAGRPLPQASIDINGYFQFPTDEHGQFTIQFRSLTDWPYAYVEHGGYATRSWRMIAPGAKEYRFILTPGDPTAPAPDVLPIPALAADQPAPPIDALWINTPTGRPPILVNDAGKPSAIWLIDDYYDSDTFKSQISDFAKICAAQNATGVIILPPSWHDSGIHARLDPAPPELFVGVDRYIPNNFVGPTRRAYGEERMVILDASGTIIDKREGIDGLDQALAH